ncbi:MAG TPA: hypothetical protein ENN20_08675 [Candidatus Marinimicrobia bacterium]|nr:hypothetical protein [Candidatus Neomarinimicrobiota bacterium]
MKLIRTTLLTLCLSLKMTLPLGAQTAELQEARLQEALKAMNRMEHKQARDIFLEAARHEPYHPLGPFGAVANEWIYNQGKYGHASGNRELLADIEDVLLDYRRQLLLDPENTEIIYYMGLANGLRARVLLAEKDYLGVLISGYRIIRNFKSALKENPDDPDVIIAFGVFNYYVGLSSKFMKIASWILQISGSKEEGLQQIETAALQGNYSRYEARNLLAYLNLYFEANYREAQRWLDMLLEDFPDNPYFNYMYAEMKIQSGNPAIEENLARIEKRLPTMEPFFRKEYQKRLTLFRGSRAFLEGDLELAARLLSEYIAAYDSEMDFDLGNACVRLGKVYDLQGRRQAAVSMYKKAAALDNRSAAMEEARRYLAEPYAE